MTEKEFKDTIRDWNLKVEDNDVQKLVDRFINSVGFTIDTNILLEHMYDDTAKREVSAAKAMKKVVESTIIDKISKKLHQKKLSRKVIDSLKDLDKDHNRYLSATDIKQGFHNANFKLSTAQVDEMLANIKTNKDGHYNYHILLWALFGDDYEREITEQSKPSARSSTRYDDERSGKKLHSRNHRDDRSEGRESKSRGRDDRSEGRESKSRGRDDRSERDSRSRQRGRSTKDVREDSSKHDERDEKANHRQNKSQFRDDRSKSKDERSRTKDSKSRNRDELRDRKSRGTSSKDDRSRTRFESGKNRESRSKSRGQSRSRPPIGHQAKAIGKRMDNSRYDYIAHLKHIAGDDKDYILTDSQVYKLLDAAKIKLSPNEKDDFVRDMGDSRFTIEEFLINWGLDLKPFKHDEIIESKIILSTDEKERAKKLLKEIGNSIVNEKKEFEKIFNIGPYDSTVDFIEVKYGIENDLDQNCANIAGDYKSMNLIRNYLLSESNIHEKGSKTKDLISIKLLHVSLFPPEEGVGEIKSKMNLITDFIQFLKENPEVDIDKTFGGDITHEKFDKIMSDYDFQISEINMIKLKEAFSSPKEPDKISSNLIKKNINLLAPDHLNKVSVTSKKEVVNRLSHVDSKIKETLEKISTYLKKERVDTMTFFDKWDEDGDGVITEDEFTKWTTTFKITGVKDKHCREAFQAMDVNKNGTLTIGEIWLYIEGSQPSNEERNIIIEKELETELNDQINDMFNEFKDDSKHVTKDSIRKILTAYNVPTSIISKSLANIRTDNEGKITKKDFKKYMMEFLKENILEVENDINELRAMFYEADINKSGFLDMDELYNFFNIKLDAHITREELRDLVNSVDLDFNGELDVDEFIDLMTKNPGDKGGSGSAQATYLKIKKRKFDMTEFIKFLRKFPDHFQESFSTRLYKNKKCLPSSVFTTWIIPHDEQSVKTTKSIRAEPMIKTTETTIAAQILLEGAKGVPFPEEEIKSSDEITKRVVRVWIFDFDTNKFIGNSAHIVAKYDNRYKDEWKFNKWGETGTNPLIFRTDQLDIKNRNVCLIFEFVIYWKQDKDNLKELNWGWWSLKISELDRKSAKPVLDIVGGSPELQTEIPLLSKHKTKKGNSKLTISTRGLRDFSQESIFHFKMLPSICIFQKRLIAFIVGFRNYLGKQRFEDINSGEALMLPNSDYILVTFPKILDNPDFWENVLQYWNDSVIKKLNKKSLNDIEKLVELTETVISKLYPVAYSTTFDLGEHNIELAAECFTNIPDLKDTRKALIINALNDRPLDFVAKGNFSCSHI